MKKYAREVYYTVRETLEKSGLPAGAPIPEWLRDHFNFDEYFAHTELQSVAVLMENAIFGDFGDEDFIFYTNERDDRAPITVRMGSLLIAYCPQGKASFKLEIKFIDKEARQTRTLFNFKGARYPYFQFTDLVPFSLNGKNATAMTMAMASREERESLEAINVRQCAQQIRAVLMRMALNEPVPLPEFQEKAANFFAANEQFNTAAGLGVRHVNPRAQASQARVSSPPQFFANPHELQELDVRNFCDERFKTRKPRNETELAAKLAAYFYANLGIDDEEIKQIVCEYINQTGKPFSEMDSEWIKTVMSVPIDLERYCLQGVIYEDTPGNRLLKVISEIQLEEAADCEFLQGFNV